MQRTLGNTSRGGQRDSIRQLPCIQLTPAWSPEPHMILQASLEVILRYKARHQL